MSESYDVYRPAETPQSRQTPAEPDALTGWQVLVEYSNRGDAKPSTVVRVFDRVHASADEAHRAARKRAAEFEPPDPAFPRGRAVYRDGDGFLTVVQGAMSTFHFSTRVVSLLENV